MKVLYLDESGDHNLSRVDSKYPVFVLGGAIIDIDYAQGHLVEKLNEFKKDLLGATDVIMHTADIKRNRNGFEALKDQKFRTHFYKKLNTMMTELDYSVVACAIDKMKLRYSHNYFSQNLPPIYPKSESYEYHVDVYDLSMRILTERFVWLLSQSNDTGIIIVESRTENLNETLKLSWEKIKIQGTGTVQAVDVKKHIMEFNLRNKKDNLAGLQIADLIVSPIGRHVLGKADRQDWHIVNQKTLINPITEKKDGIIVK